MLSYHLLVGADGAGSMVRQATAEVLPLGFCQQRVADARSAVAALPPLEPDGITHSTYEKYDFKVCRTGLDITRMDWLPAKVDVHRLTAHPCTSSGVYGWVLDEQLAPPMCRPTLATGCAVEPCMLCSSRCSRAGVKEPVISLSL